MIGGVGKDREMLEKAWHSEQGMRGTLYPAADTPVRQLQTAEKIERPDGLVQNVGQIIGFCI